MTVPARSKTILQDDPAVDPDGVIVRLPGQRDPVATRRALLAAARREFAAKGLAGARVDEIARLAGVNKQLVYHHFGNKDDLYQAVLETVYADIREHERALQLGDLEPLAAMERLVEFSFDYLLAHPEFVALVNDENQQGARHLKCSQGLREMHSPLISLIGETLQKGAARGLFRDDMDPVDVYISIAGVSYFYFSNGLTLSQIFGLDLASAKAVAARRAHVVAFVLGALRPVAINRTVD